MAFPQKRYAELSISDKYCFCCHRSGISTLTDDGASLSWYIVFPVYIVCITGRLLCNLFDGMVAIEGGKRSENGDLFNDIPDRFSDVLLLVPAGYIAGGWGIELAWLAAILAIMTAYAGWVPIPKENIFSAAPWPNKTG